MTPLGLYEPGGSVLHRAPAGAKLLAVVALATAVVLLGSPWWLGGLLAVVLAGYVVARVPARRWLPLVRTLVIVSVVVFGVQWWLLGASAAAVVCLRLVTALAAASLFTLTTRVDDVVSTVERVARPLRRFGVRPETIGLLVGLTVQAIATLSGIAGEVRAAAKARGADRSPTAFVVPFLVRTLRHADQLGEALAARGAGDP
ncbi:energy-coupling factor transporter transmembrane component T family protein [Prauserella rugosa]|uniref:Biotin transport system permease protein n=1 Tax=Prauserella rugosa TaxID=43354 RepID=A0A660CJ12_9PSEU|nr:energy-coupling factor transporter transmembrane protein EcfT [Prauserella rugosa]KMS84722.1 cobalt transporter [Streptomyces regensis]TWH21579.1 biotin transport system permease protein [Prauserella rugosa]